MTGPFRKSRGFALLVLSAAPIALTGCQGSGAFATLQENLSTLADQQAQMLVQMQQLSAKVDAIEIPAAPHGARGKDAKRKPGSPDPKVTYKVDVGDAHRTGGKQPLVTLVAWSDFQCPYCARVGPTMTQLEKEYGDDLAIVFKHNPLSFHKRAMAAALAAEAAGRQGKFWPMHDKLFANNKALTDDNFVTFAQQLQLDVETFRKDLADDALAAKIKRQQTQGVSLGARGTPAFFVNGRFVSGAQPLAAFKTLIDEEKKKAERLIAAGTPRAKVYDAVVGKGRSKV